MSIKKEGKTRTLNKGEEGYTKMTVYTMDFIEWMIENNFTLTLKEISENIEETKNIRIWKEEIISMFIKLLITIKRV